VTTPLSTSLIFRFVLMMPSDCASAAVTPMSAMSAADPVTDTKRLNILPDITIPLFVLQYITIKIDRFPASHEVIATREWVFL
jgi:hypothetical protein